MFINNVSELNIKTYTCGKTMYNYLKDKAPLLGINEDGEYVYSKTVELCNIVESAPFFTKVVSNKCKL